MAEAKQAEAHRIGELIATLREQKGWSQEDLAQKVEVSTSTISRWERGLHKGYGPNIRKLAKALKVEPSVLTPVNDLMIGSQLDRIEAGINEILEWVRQKAAAEAAESELEALPALLSEADGQPKRPTRQRSSKRQAAGQRKSA